MGSKVADWTRNTHCGEVRPSNVLRPGMHTLPGRSSNLNLTSSIAEHVPGCTATLPTMIAAVNDLA